MTETSRTHKVTLYIGKPRTECSGQVVYPVSALGAYLTGRVYPDFLVTDPGKWVEAAKVEIARQERLSVPHTLYPVEVVRL
jgi:hypothetical protein